MSVLSVHSPRGPIASHFFFNDTATTEIYTLSLHDALPISTRLLRHEADATSLPRQGGSDAAFAGTQRPRPAGHQDRKSTRLNSSHVEISYAVFCLKKKKATTRGCVRSGAANRPAARSDRSA